jgi:predicted RNA polymerase sigma factor
LTTPRLSDEAIRLTRWLSGLLPDDAEVTGLLALMLLTDARRAARTSAHGELVQLADQNRSLWDEPKIAEGVALISGVLPRGEVGPYQLQAAIAAVHDEAESMTATDWPQILALYDLLVKVAPNPVASLNRAVALAEVHGPVAGLAELEPLEADPRIAGSHRLLAARAHMLEQAGETAAAAECYREAARRATSRPERVNLVKQAARLSG